MSKKKRFGGWEIIEESRKGKRLKRRSKRSQKENKGKQAASCVSHFSQLRHLVDNPTVHIEDLWVENNISKFQLNPTVDEVAMAVFPKEVCPAPGQRLASAWRRQKSEGWRLASAWPAPEAPEHADSIKTRFSDEKRIQLQFFLLPFDSNSQNTNPSSQEPEKGHPRATPSLGER